jgi:hypothetical protein
MDEKPLPYRLVVESDLIRSKHGTWHEVLSSGLSRNEGRMAITFRGQDGKPIRINPRADLEVMVRRGPTGVVVDRFAVLFSGQTSPDLREPIETEDES